jgi:hypothetical protein
LIIFHPLLSAQSNLIPFAKADNDNCYLYPGYVLPLSRFDKVIIAFTKGRS